MKRVLSVFCTFLLSSLASTIFAHQAQIIDLLEIKQAQKGNARSISGELIFYNKTNSIIKLNQTSLKDRQYNFIFRPSSLLVKAKSRFRMKFSGSIVSNGKYQILAKIPIFYEKNSKPIGYFNIDLYFKVTGRSPRSQIYEVSNYEKLFIKEGSFKEAGMGIVYKSEKPNPKFPQIKASRFPNLKNLPINPSRDSIYKIPNNTSNKIRSSSHDHLRDILRPRNLDIFRFNENSNFNFDLESSSFHTSSTTVNAQGVFSWLGTDNSYHPAFAWRVRAWTRKNSSSTWTKRAEDWIQWNGSWSLKFRRPSGHKVKFQYIAFNRFFTPQSNTGETYRWVGPEHNSVSQNHNEGSWSANTSTGNLRGLGEMYHEGARYWSKLYWTGGINPLRNKSIRVIFPNLSYDCGSGTSNPWSCANTSGNIWLIPSHALTTGVMTHELSHQINYEFWNNNRPPNSGGSHTLSGCFTEGLALLEGFANFMESWLFDSRSASNPTSSGINLENVPSHVCTTKSKNETYVAATFWDLHDSHNDNKDRLWFVHPGAVPGIYLRTGKKNSMKDFRLVYKNAANQEHESIVNNIFKQNYNF